MSNTDANLSLALLEALDAFDQKTLPLGLYACEEHKAMDKPFPRLHQEWHLCLKPCLEAFGCSTGWANIRDGAFNFNLPDKTRAEMRVVRTSKIKVRKFGSAYRLEPHNKYEERWQELRMDRDLSNLWKPSALAERHIGLRLFLFIGFAKEPDPFGKELAQLSEQLRWDENRAHYETRAWADREDRHFFVRLSAWCRPNP
ncbi:MAG: hypothetical protein ACRYFS_12190 [Janthinobacterium lividum]